MNCSQRSNGLPIRVFLFAAEIAGEAAQLNDSGAFWAEEELSLDFRALRLGFTLLQFDLDCGLDAQRRLLAIGLDQFLEGLQGGRIGVLLGWLRSDVLSRWRLRRGNGGEVQV